MKHVSNYIDLRMIETNEMGLHNYTVANIMQRMLNSANIRRDVHIEYAV